MATHEREITEPVELCLPGGRLNPAAVGWTRRPLHRTGLRGWGRAKRWEYWGVVTPDHILGLVASSLDYAGVHGVYVLDRATGRETSKDVVVPLARGAGLADGEGAPTAVTGPGLSISISEEPGGTRLRASASGVEIDLVAARPEGHESLGVVVPWSSKRFQYTVKDLGRPVSGTLRLGGTELSVRAEDSFAVLDHGRGKWPYAITWNWAAGVGDGVALQLGGKWTDGTGMTENGLFLGGRLHKIGEELTWAYDRGDWLKPWRIAGPRVEVEFTPFHEKVSRTELVVVGSETHQCFGHFTGPRAGGRRLLGDPRRAHRLGRGGPPALVAPRRATPTLGEGFSSLTCRFATKMLPPIWGWRAGGRGPRVRGRSR